MSGQDQNRTDDTTMRQEVNEDPVSIVAAVGDLYNI